MADITGNNKNNTLKGTNEDDWIEGLGGNDILTGSSGYDFLFGGDLFEDAGFDTVDYSLLGNGITLLPFGEVDKGSRGFDQLFDIEKIVASNTSNDVIDASTSFFGIVVNLGTNTLNIPDVGLQFQVFKFENVFGSDWSDDNITGDSGKNLLVGNAGNDYLAGGAGDDILNGGSDNDYLDGGTGNDTLNGGAGIDTLTGGAGNDVHVFQFGQCTAAAPDRITDFAFGTDKIDLLTSSGLATPTPTSFSRAANNTATTLTSVVTSVFADANGALAGLQALGVNSAALVVATNAAIAGTYLVVNDGTAGFQAANDLVVNLTGYTGTLPALGNITPVTNFFV